MPKLPRGVRSLVVPSVLVAAGALHGALVGRYALLVGAPLTLAAIGVYLLRERPLRANYSLMLPVATPVTSGYRDAAPLAIGPVLERLRGLGYAPELLLLDDEGRPADAACATTPLRGPRLWLRDARSRWAAAGLALHFPETAGYGSLEVHDLSTGFYRELGLFFLVSLSESVRGIEFKVSCHSRSFESTEWLRRQLPARPRARLWALWRILAMAGLLALAAALPPVVARVAAVSRSITPDEHRAAIHQTMERAGEVAEGTGGDER